RYQALKKKPITEAQARKNMMIYLKNMVVFKMDFFKGITYNDIRPIFENHYNSIRAFLKKGEKEIAKDGSKRKGDSLNQDVAKKQRIDEETEELKTHLHIIANDDDDVYTKATPLALKDTNEAKPAKVEEVIEIVTAAKLMTKVVTTAATTIIVAQVPKASAPRRTRGVVIQDPKETATASVIVHSEVKSNDKGKGILIKDPNPLKRQA
nr:hypothetical protein [Tanacetum cinerariifolium]